jgi:hypothetical protein
MRINNYYNNIIIVIKIKIYLITYRKVNLLNTFDLYIVWFSFFYYYYYIRNIIYLQDHKLYIYILLFCSSENNKISKTKLEHF